MCLLRASLMFWQCSAVVPCRIHIHMHLEPITNKTVYWFSLCYRCKNIIFKEKDTKWCTSFVSLQTSAYCIQTDNVQVRGQNNDLWDKLWKADTRSMWNNVILRPHLKGTRGQSDLMPTDLRIWYPLKSTADPSTSTSSSMMQPINKHFIFSVLPQKSHLSSDAYDASRNHS